MRQRISQPECDIIAVDNSPAMIERGQKLLASDTTSAIPVKMVCANIQDVTIENASVVVLNFTLQFIPLEERLTLIEHIYQGLKPGGVLILSEKIRFESEPDQAFNDTTHLAYKKANGYSELEISQKRTALENIMIVDSEAEHRERLTEAGFRRIDCWFRCLNWVSFLAYQ